MLESVLFLLHFYFLPLLGRVSAPLGAKAISLRTTFRMKNRLIPFFVILFTGFSSYVQRKAKPPRVGVKIGFSSYNIKSERLSDGGEAISSRFVQLSEDEEMRGFLKASAQVTASTTGQTIMFFRQMLVNLLQNQLGWTRPDARAFAGMSGLYVASEQQFESVLKSTFSQGKRASSMLDIGSGTGSETVKIASVLGLDRSDVMTLEASKPLQKNLRLEGFTVGESIPTR